jgi:hypothetical protein
MNIEIRGNEGILIASIERAENLFQVISTSSNFVPGKRVDFEDRKGNKFYADTYRCVKTHDLEFHSGLTKLKMYPTYYIKIIV